MATNFLSRLFTAVNNPATSFMRRHYPIINEITSSLNIYASTSQIAYKRNLMNWYREIPELTALVNKVAKDIVYKYHFEPVDPRSSSRNKILKANQFASEHELKKVLLSQAVDQLVTGDAFGWKGKIGDNELKEQISKRMNEFSSNLETKELEFIKEDIFLEMKAFDGYPVKTILDEDATLLRKYRSIPSSTVEILYNDVEVKGFVQKVGLNTVEFNKEEIIHYTLMDIDGRVNGFTSVQSVLIQLELLRQMWRNMLSIHKNGGVPDIILGLEGVNPGHPAYRRIEAQLEKYKPVENKHGVMLFTGGLTVHELNQLDKMQFMDSGLYVTGLIAMQWQVPRSSIPYIVGGTNLKEDTGGNADRDYWRNIDFAQDIFADTMNSQLWIPHFGVKIVFDNPYVQGEVQEQTARQLKIQNLMSESDLLSRLGLQLKSEMLTKDLGRTDLEVEKLDPKLIPGFGDRITGTDNQLSKNDVKDPENTKNKKNRKRLEQNKTIEATGMKPTGVGKEYVYEPSNQWKDFYEKKE